jgi:hypothetical protein
LECCSFLLSLLQYSIRFHFVLSFSIEFLGIRSFILRPQWNSSDYIEPIEQLENFIHPNLCPQLQSLRLPYCSRRQASWIFTGAFPLLKCCHLYDDRYSNIILPSLTNHRIQSLCQLTVQSRDGDKLEKILLLCPNLNYLDFSCDTVLSSFDHLNSPYPSLKHLRLCRIRSFLFHYNDNLDRLLSFFPNLIHFDLTVDQCQISNETLDFHRIAQHLSHRVSRLKIFDLRIYVNTHSRSSLFRQTFKRISQIHPLFKSLGRTGSLLHIASFDFTPTHHYDQMFIRRSPQ